jgi:uncharacterized protein (TIGR02421 family)
MSEKVIIKELSDRIVEAQQPIRILNAIKWDEEIKETFRQNKCNVLPKIDASYYERYPLPYDPTDKINEFKEIIRDIKNQLGVISGISRMMVRTCEEYSKAIEMLVARGTADFSAIAMELYGSPDDAFYPAGPRLSEFGELLGDILSISSQQLSTEKDEKIYTAEEAQVLLQTRLDEYFPNHTQSFVNLSDTMVADASAGAQAITLNQNVMFSERDIRYLEVHEGWVHLGTSLNGAEQPYCTFLGKGSPSSSITQEGLAVITEIFTFSAHPQRLLKITNRIRALEMARQGADFIEVFRFFEDQGFDFDESYNYSVRIFRGSTPNLGPFTKDLAYARGVILLYNYMRLAVQKNLLRQIPVFFVGKTLIEDVQILTHLIDDGIVTPPRYLPPQFKDLSALSSWMSLSLYLNRFDLSALEKHYRQILHE